MNPPETNPDFLKGHLILVVDDEPDNVEVIQELLELNGAEVMAARNGREGLELAQRRPDLIITDLAMPVMTGYEMLAALKNDRAMAEIPVIALTGHALDSYRNAAFEAGCHNFLVKPLTSAVFLKEVFDVLTDAAQRPTLLPPL